MKVVHTKHVARQKIGPALFTGKVIRYSPVTDTQGSQLSIDYVHFPKGIRNKFHKHSNDQVLIVMQGAGIVATKTKKVHVTKGDVVWAPAGEIHWHGASSHASFTHISVTKGKTKLTQVEK